MTEDVFSELKETPATISLQIQSVLRRSPDVRTFEKNLEDRREKGVRPKRSSDIVFDDPDMWEIYEQVLREKYYVSLPGVGEHERKHAAKANELGLKVRFAIMFGADVSKKENGSIYYSDIRVQPMTSVIFPEDMSVTNQKRLLAEIAAVVDDPSPRDLVMMEELNSSTS